jgi:hypothetical protein
VHLDEPRLTFRAIPASVLPDWWRQVEPFVASACVRGHEKYRPADILKALIARHMQLWASTKDHAVEAICITEIVTYPAAKVCRILISTGSDPGAMVQFMVHIEEWAKAEGCSAMEALARPGWEGFVRPFGYAKTHVLFEKTF